MLPKRLTCRDCREEVESERVEHVICVRLGFTLSSSIDEKAERERESARGKGKRSGARVYSHTVALYGHGVRVPATRSL